MSVLQGLDWFIVFAYFAVILGLAWVVMKRQKNTADGYFLAGRSLGWFVVGASIFASNIGSEHLVGLAGSGATDGVAMAHYELHAWCLLVLGWVMEIDVKVTFPENYHADTLKGKEALFKVTVNEIKYKEIPVLDDEFAQDVSEFDTLDEYKADVRATLEKTAREAADEKYENDVIKKAVDNAEVVIPDVMVERQLDNILKRIEMSLRYQGMELKNYLDMMGMEEETLRNDYRDKALQDVKTQLVLEKI